MITGNIDIIDAKYNTNAPFLHSCKLQFNGIQVPAEYFKCIKLYCDETNVLPCRIINISLSQIVADKIEIVFGDKNNNEVGTWWLAKPAPTDKNTKFAFICNKNRSLRGYIVYDKNIYNIFNTILVGNNKIIASSTDDFILIPPCCVPYFKGTARSIAVNNRVTCNNVGIYPSYFTRTGYYLDTDPTKNDTYSIGVIGGYSSVDKQSENGICKLNIYYANEVYPMAAKWLGGVDLFINHSVTSNMRLPASGGNISVQGVLNGK